MDIESREHRQFEAAGTHPYDPTRTSHRGFGLGFGDLDPQPKP